MNEESAGGVIVRNGMVAIVHNKSGHYSFPKGHIKKDENLLEAAYREINEETGLEKNDLKFIKELGTCSRPDGKSGNMKDIHIFLFTTEKKELKPIDIENADAKWVPIEELTKNIWWKEDKDFFECHIKEITRA
ncbi:MAG: NUDIX hydrolase [Candidatus Woesearchaeota archaeon]|nr:NUDIX hydrolase [Candidatus Woesearchaeota archaeon]